MKIISDKNSDRPPFLDHNFKIEMTGEELLRMWLLSYENEGYDRYPDDADRFCNIIANHLCMTEEELKCLSNRLEKGKFV